MATVTGFTATRMQDIEDSSIVDADVVAGDLILTRHDGTQINAGPVVGPAGPSGAVGPQGHIPGEIKLWPSNTLPVQATYGLWTWANGGIFDVLAHPLANAHIDPAWKIAMGQSDPGPGKFRVPDLRGLVPAGLDAMPVGSGRMNRIARSVAITIAARTGEELHKIELPEIPAHAHGGGWHSHTAGTDAQNAPHTHQYSVDFNLVTNGAQGSGNNRVTGIVSTGGTHNIVEDTYSGNAYHSHGVTVNANWAGITSEGGSGSHENVQPTIFVPYIVKLDD